MYKSACRYILSLHISHFLFMQAHLRVPVCPSMLLSMRCYLVLVCLMDVTRSRNAFCYYQLTPPFTFLTLDYTTHFSLTSRRSTWSARIWTLNSIPSHHTKTNISIPYISISPSLWMKVRSKPNLKRRKRD